MKLRSLLLLLIMLGFADCHRVYYGTMEKLGKHKREIMVDRVKDARDTQNKARAQFLTAMDQFKSVVKFQGGDLEEKYNDLHSTLKKSESAAEDVHKRIGSVEDVSEALFKEWREEMDQYNSDALRRSSQQKYDVTRAKYLELIAAMKRAESKLEPALVPLRDQVLFMKHNLNANAIAGLSDEVVSVQANVDQLVRDIDSAVAQADAFIASLRIE
jgi:hypothetical protein